MNEHARLPGLRRQLSGEREIRIWDAAYAAAYAQLLLRSEPDLDLHAYARSTAKLVADAAVVGYHELVREKAGRAWNRGLSESVGDDPEKPPILSP